MGFNQKLEQALRVEDMMSKTEQELGDITRGQPTFLLGHTLHSLFGYAVYGLAHLLIALLIVAVWPEPRLAALIILPIVPAAFFGTRASYLAECHIFWIVGELRRGV